MKVRCSHTSLAVLWIAGMTALGAGCDRGAPAPAGGSTPQAADAPAPTPAASTSGPPRLALDQAEVRFGAMSETETRSSSVGFSNTGGQTLIIREIKTTCGCTAASLDKRRYAPGERGRIDVTFEPTAPGEQVKYIKIISNAQPDGLVQIPVRADVQPFLVVEPTILRLGALRYRQEHQARVTVASPTDEHFSIESVHTTNPSVSADVVNDVPRGTSPGQKAVEVTISPDAPWGPLFSWLQITARGRPAPDAEPVSYTRRIRVQGQIFGELSASPDTFRYGISPGERFERTVRLSRPSGEPFTIVEISVSSPCLVDAGIAVRPVAPNAYDLVLTANGPAVAIERCDGVIAITTDVPGEEAIRIPVVGAVRAATP